jgi:hypothetical protein
MSVESGVNALAARVAEEFNTVREEGTARVVVSTGGEARPNVAFVIWLGGTTEPTNMAVGDLWMSEGA